MSAAPPSSSKPPALPALTSLRFFAALAIVVHHCNGVFWPAAELGPLDAGVSFFFVLSGFVLTYVYADLPSTAAAWRGFYRARLARIWPLHSVCLLLTICLVATPEPFNPLALCANLLLVHAWLPWDRLFFSYNYVSWSISTELFFYLFLPVLLTWRSRWLWLGMALSVCVAIALACASDWFDLETWQTGGNEISATGLLYSNPLTRAVEFLLGIASARLFMRRRSAPYGTIARGTLFELASTAAFAVGFVLVAAAGKTGLVDHAGPVLKTLATEWVQHVALAPLAACLIYVFAHPTGAIARILSHRALVYAGEISFALYLVHQLLLRALQSRVAHPGAIAFAGYLVVCLLAAVLLHGLVERPARRWLTAPRGR